jgi:hypothetical protein
VSASLQVRASVEYEQFLSIDVLPELKKAGTEAQTGQSQSFQDSSRRSKADRRESRHKHNDVR